MLKLVLRRSLRTIAFTSEGQKPQIKSGHKKLQRVEGVRKMRDMKTAAKSKCGEVGGEGKRREKEGKWTHTKALGFGPVLGVGCGLERHRQYNVLHFPPHFFY